MRQFAQFALRWNLFSGNCQLFILIAALFLSGCGGRPESARAPSESTGAETAGEAAEVAAEAEMPVSSNHGNKSGAHPLAPTVPSPPLAESNNTQLGEEPRSTTAELSAPQQITAPPYSKLDIHADAPEATLGSLSRSPSHSFNSAPIPKSADPNTGGFEAPFPKSPPNNTLTLRTLGTSSEAELFPKETPTEEATESEEGIGILDEREVGDSSPLDQVAAAGTEEEESTSANDAEKNVNRRDKAAVDLGNTVNVYFATDRLPTAELLPSAVRTFAPAGVVFMLCCALFIGFSAARRLQAAWLVSCGLAVCAGLVVLHASIIRWQQYSRLASDASTRFSTSRYESGAKYPLHVGLAKVSLPKTHKAGIIESPSILRLEFVETPEKHVVLHSLHVEESVEEWFRKLSGQYTARGECFIFIHGYNVRFADALKRTAQLSTDLELSGPAVCYSWPSQGQVAGYKADEATVSWSAPHFEQLLRDIKSKTDCRHLNIVAHSMGNRALLQAIERLSIRQADDDSTQGEPFIENLVMAAPDVDVQAFESRYASVVRSIASRTTLYFSKSDRALQLSATVHSAGRLGLLDSSHAAFAGIDAIDIGKQSLFSLGHSYYGSNTAVIDDLRVLLHEDKSAGQRHMLRQLSDARGNDYWQLDRRLHASRSTPTNR